MTAQALLDDYAAFHKDRRNKLTHYIGIPMIVVAIMGLLRAVVLTPTIDLAMVILAPVLLYYMIAARLLGFLMALVMVGSYFLAGYLSPLVSLVLFVVGWIFQYVGHFYEGKKPAFYKNALHLLAGPLFILNHALTAIGIRISIP